MDDLWGILSGRIKDICISFLWWVVVWDCSVSYVLFRVLGVLNKVFFFVC